VDGPPGELVGPRGRAGSDATGGRRRGRGFTVLELVIVIIVVVLLAAILLPGMVGGRGRRGVPRQIKDGTQVRGIHQGMVLFAQNNNDKFPLPSLLDPDNFTIDAAAETKDTTANIISVLIYQNFFTPELCVSPSETNPNIRIDNAFAFTAPPTAANPAKALWDPGFNADFSTANPARMAGFSYAHQMPFGPRRDKKWNNSFSSNDAIVANRGPLVTNVTKGKEESVDMAFNKDSLTLLIHGGRKTWEGNVAYNDNSIQFETSMAPETKFWSEKPEADTSKTLFPKWRDCLFFDEKDDPNTANNFLVNVKKVGENGPEVIWD
jgi:type II secretory pathway pseudopilin PulG